MFEAGSGTLITTIISTIILGFAFWIIHKITNL